MAYSQKPCVCGGTTFHVFPDIRWMVPGSGHQLVVTAVICRLCTRTETFAINAENIAPRVVNARVISAGQG